MIDPKSFVATLTLICGLAGVASVFGLFPMRYARNLYRSARPVFSLVDLFALGLIEVACFGYMWSTFSDGDVSEHLALALGAVCVATFWWFVIATRLPLPGLGSVARGAYLCFFVTAAFVCPFIVALSIVELILPFDERPGMDYESDVTGAVVAALLYVVCFPLNRWLSNRYEVVSPSADTACTEPSSAG